MKKFEEANVKFVALQASDSITASWDVDYGDHTINDGDEY